MHNDDDNSELSDDERALFRHHIKHELNANENTKAFVPPEPESNFTLPHIDRDYFDYDIQADETVSYRQAGVRDSEFRALKQGKLSISSRLDLHGSTQADAHELLEQFLQEALIHKARCIQVVHGKGLSSIDKCPVLKNYCAAVLKRCDVVLAYHSAPVKQGGTGALNILLRTLYTKR